MRALIATALLPLLSLAACGGDSTTPAGATPAGEPPAPAPSASFALDHNQAVTVFLAEPAGTAKRGRIRNEDEQVALGRMLYEDARLSKNGDISCNTCHPLDNYGQDGKPTSPGTGGLSGKRNSPTTFNAFRQFAQFWDYRADSVEEQATMPMMTENEHGFADEAELVAKLESIPAYAEPFAKAFPRDEKPISAENVRLAIGAFERKLQTRSRWDDYLDGDDGALTAEEKKGLKAFIDLSCTTCHMGRLVGGSMSQKLGLYKPVDFADKGRFELTKNPADEYLFKVPQLLNVEKTAPYYHDGSMATLEEAVKHMAEHQTTVKASQAQLDSIVVFLKALTGKPPKIVAQ